MFRQLNGIFKHSEPEIFRNKTQLDLAEIFYRYSYYDLAAVNAGKAFEEAVIKKCRQGGIPVRNNYDNKPRPLFDLVNELSSKMNWKDSDLHDARKIRNKAAHPAHNPLTKEDVKLLLDVIRKYFLELNSVVWIQRAGDKSKGEMVVSYREFTDWLNQHYMAETKCPTLGGKSNFLFRYDKGENIGCIKRSTGREGFLEESQLKQFFHLR